MNANATIDDIQNQLLLSCRTGKLSDPYDKVVEGG